MAKYLRDGRDKTKAANILNYFFIITKKKKNMKQN